MSNNRRILAGPWLLALFAMALVACSSPAAAPAPISTSPPATIPSANAIEYMGDKGTVCGPVTNIRNDIRPRTVPRTSRVGSSTQGGFALDFDQPFPDQTFVVIVYPEDEENFTIDPEGFYKDKEVCATGSIHNAYGMPDQRLYAVPYMRVDEESDLEVMR